MVTATKKKTTQLKEILHRKGKPAVCIIPPSPMVARMLERAGFDYVFIGGDATLANMLGRTGQFWGLAESLFVGKLFVDAVDIPVIIDADFLRPLGPIYVQRAVQEYIRIGLAGVDMDDRMLYQGLDSETAREATYDPNRLVESSYQAIPTEAMVEKIRAAVAAKKDLDPDFVIIVRCYGLLDTRTTMDQAIQRMRAYQDAGADAMMLRGFKTVEELKQMKKAMDIPCIASSNALTQLKLTLEDGAEIGLAEMRCSYVLDRVMHNVAWEFLQDYQERGPQAALDWLEKDRGKTHPFAREGGG